MCLVRPSPVSLVYLSPQTPHRIHVQSPFPVQVCVWPAPIWWNISTFDHIDLPSSLNSAFCGARTAVGELAQGMDTGGLLCYCRTYCSGLTLVWVCCYLRLWHIAIRGCCVAGLTTRFGQNTCCGVHAHSLPYSTLLTVSHCDIWFGETSSHLATWTCPPHSTVPSVMQGLQWVSLHMVWAVVSCSLLCYLEHDALAQQLCGFVVTWVYGTYKL